MKPLLLAALLALVSGCAGEAWYVDERFSEDEFADIDRGAQLWRDVGMTIDLVQGAHVTGLANDRHEIFRTNKRGMNTLIPELNGADAEAATNGPKDRIAFNMPRIHEPLWQVAAHEFGHALGIDNHVTSNPYAIMGISAPMVQCVTRADLDALCAVRECMSRLKGCDE